MSSKLFYIMIGVGVIGGLILYFQNTINSVTLYSPFGTKSGSVIILYSIALGFISGFGLSGIISGDKENGEDEDGF
ncbi:hypothetical protein H3C61_00775 [Candidatus Gracilibacteria bacterium]|nr:hypothetical protein [Candidatus Gracilibacteria bacterium]